MNIGRQISPLRLSAGPTGIKAIRIARLAMAALLLALPPVMSCGKEPSKVESPVKPPLNGLWYGVADGITASLDKPDLAFALELVQAGDSVTGHMGWSYETESWTLSGRIAGQTVRLDCFWCNCQLQGELAGNNLAGYRNDYESGTGSRWIAARAGPTGSRLAGAWSGTAFGRFPLAWPAADYAFFLTTVPVGDSLYGTMDPTEDVPIQLRIRGRITADSIRFKASGAEFLGVVADTILAGRWRWADGHSGVVESTWVAHRIDRKSPGIKVQHSARPLSVRSDGER